MNKSELISKVAEFSEITKNDAGKVVSVIFEEITEALKAEDTVRLIGFGTFSVKTRAAKKGRNPQTGKEIEIPAKAVPKFTAAKKLKREVLISLQPNKEILKKLIDTFPLFKTKEVELEEVAKKSGVTSEEAMNALEFLLLHGIVKGFKRRLIYTPKNER